MMKEFFHGWRRKAGVVLLGLALLLCSGWMRSKYIQEAFSFRLFYQGQVVYSASGAIYWWTVPSSQLPSQWMKRHQPVPDTLTYDGIKIHTKLITSWGKYKSTYHRQQIRTLAIPYWKAVIPLTLLSAYLLLWKPRKQP